MNILEELYDMIQDEDTQEIHPHDHLNMVIIDPLKVSFVLTNSDNDVVAYADFYSGEPICSHYFHRPNVLSFSDMLGQLEPMEVTGHCMILEDIQIVVGWIKQANFTSLIQHFPDYQLIKLSELGSHSDMSVVAQIESIKRLADAIKRNFGTIKPE